MESLLASKSNIQGALIVDSNGLCISSHGDLAQPAESINKTGLAGRFASISKLAYEAVSTIDPNHSSYPSVLIETEERNIFIKEHDLLTIVLSCKNE